MMKLKAIWHDEINKGYMYVSYTIKFKNGSYEGISRFKNLANEENPVYIPDKVTIYKKALEDLKHNFTDSLVVENADDPTVDNESLVKLISQLNRLEKRIENLEKSRELSSEEIAKRIAGHFDKKLGQHNHTW